MIKNPSLENDKNAPFVAKNSEIKSISTTQ